ncbi:MAG: exo-alpha-sialidase, partial [Acidobacteriota bacterium]
HDHGHGEMTLRYVKIRRDGTLTDEAVLDGRVCECCQTAVAVTADGPVVVYRDRTLPRQGEESEIRDISIVRRRGSRWSAPQTVSTDHWELSGCPVNGPAIAARGRQVAVAWYTAAGDAPRVKLAFSNDAGESFGKPLTIDDGQPIGRVDLLLHDDGSALVSWLEKTPGGGALRLRRIDRSGKAAEAVTIAPSGTARSNGFPQMVRRGNQLLFAWTATGIRTATMNLP